MTKPRAALLIDGDNISADYLLVAQRALVGLCDIQIRQLFCDFGAIPNGWTREICDRHAITPVQHFRHSHNKNGADIALTIAAMDLMNQGKVAAVAVMSSDSDFRPLAVRLRQAGILTICLGEVKASDGLRNAFDHFIDLDEALQPKTQVVLRPVAVAKPAPAPAVETKKTQPKAPQKAPPTATKQTLVPRVVPHALRAKIVLLMQGMNGHDEDIGLSQIVKNLRVDDPAFSTNTHGFSSISKLLNSMTEVVLVNNNGAARLSKNQPKTKEA